MFQLSCERNKCWGPPFVSWRNGREGPKVVHGGGGGSVIDPIAIRQIRGVMLCVFLTRINDDHAGALSKLLDRPLFTLASPKQTEGGGPSLVRRYAIRRAIVITRQTS